MFVALAVGCSGSPPSLNDSTGGATATSTGGATASNGGAATTGGKAGTGGSAPGGGPAASGGSTTTGGGGNTGGTSTRCGAPLAGSNGSDPTNPTYFLVDESCYATPVAAAGFIDLEPVNHTYTNRTLTKVVATSAPSRLFYSFIPALDDPKNSPVFVFFNGGPGASTTGILFAYGTGPQTIHVDATTQNSTPQANPDNWAQMGNLLYIDSRQAGFSYGVTGDPTQDTQRAAGYTEDSFNFFIDAADVVRVVLRVLGSQPALQNNPVVLVGESYGGIRSTLMLNLLLDPSAVASTQGYFTDIALSQEMQAHFAKIFENEGDVPLTRARIARQFGWQVLIEPAIDFLRQYTMQNATRCDPTYSVTKKLQEVQVACPPDQNGQLAAGILPSTRIDGTATQALLDLASFQQLLGGVNPGVIPGLSSSTRAGAYRLVTDSTDYPKSPVSWDQTQGALAGYDRYYIDVNNIVYYMSYDYEQITDLVGWYFLQNVLDVETFITRAALDLVVVPEVLPLSLLALDASHSVIDDIFIDDTQPAGAVRPGQLVFTYSDADVATGKPSTIRRVRFPSYWNSAHSVTVYQPTDLLEDVRDTLKATLPAVH